MIDIDDSFGYWATRANNILLYEETQNLYFKEICFMKMVRVEDLPSRNRFRHDLQDMIKQFIKSGDYIVMLRDFEEEYKTPESCCESMRAAIKRSGHSNIKVHMRKGNVYLENTLLG